MEELLQKQVSDILVRASVDVLEVVYHASERTVPPPPISQKPNRDAILHFLDEEKNHVIRDYPVARELSIALDIIKCIQERARELP